MKLDTTRVVLTGASGGIGQAMALALVQAGASLMLVGRSPGRLASLVRTLDRQCPGSASRVDWQAADLDQAAARQQLVDACSDWSANVLVHNAGLPSFARLDSLAPRHIEQLLRTNLLVPMLLTQAMLPQLQQQAQARIVCVGSALGSIGLPGYSVYGASKFGLRGFAEALRRELGPDPLRVQYLGPRSTRTGFNSDAAQAYQQATGSQQDEPAVVAKALLQLLESDAAERFVGFPERLGVRLNALMPAWMDGSFAKHRQALSTASTPVRARPTEHPDTQAVAHPPRGG